MVDPTNKMYEAVSDGKITLRMRLFREAASFTDSGGFTTVEAFWFQCSICGFVLHANRQSASR